MSRVAVVAALVASFSAPATAQAQTTPPPAPTTALSPAPAPPAYGHPPAYGWPPPPAGSPPPSGDATPDRVDPQPPQYPPSADQTRANEEHRQNSAHRHDGLYVRAGLGYGSLHTSSSFDGKIGTQPAGDALGEITYSGPGLALDFGIGGTPAPGLVVGYGFMGQIVHEPRVTLETPSGEEERHDSRHLGAAIHGLLLDVFPDPTGNLELGGLVGIARVSTGREGDESTGFAAGIWGGYGFWAADGASFVGLLRLGYALTQSEVESVRAPPSGAPSIIDRSDSTFTLSVVTSILVH